MTQVINTKEFIMPSDPAMIKKIKDAMNEASASYTRIEGERDFLKELFSDLSKDTELPKSYLNKIAKAWHKQNMSEAAADQEAIVELYEKIFDTEV